MSSIKLNTIGGYNKDVVKNFNETTKHFDDYELLRLIIESYCDDEDLIEITEHLKDRLIENGIEL